MPIEKKMSAKDAKGSEKKPGKATRTGMAMAFGKDKDEKKKPSKKDKK